MTVPGNIDALLLGGQRGYQIERSLRFNSADSANCSRTFSSSNRKTWTWSAWVKRSAFGTTQALFSAGSISGTYNYHHVQFDTSDRLNLLYYPDATSTTVTTTARYRDPSAWMHIVAVWDTTQSTASNRAILYVNGQQITALDTATYSAQNTDGFINSTVHASGVHYIGRLVPSETQYFSGYLTEVHFVDGQALTPSSFGETDTITGVWKPKKYSGSGYGTNGFYLKFADNSGTTSTTLGKDSSGNGNNFTPNNFSVTAGAGNDSLIDTPTPYADGGNGRGNYCTLNPITSNATGYLISPINGNLDAYLAAGSNAFFGVAGTQAITSGKFYWEVTPTTIQTGAGTWMEIGIIQSTLTYPAGTAVGSYNGGFAYTNDGYKARSNSYSSYGATWTANDVIGVALDADNGSITFYKNGVSQGAAYTDLASYNLPAGYYPAIAIYRSTGTSQYAVFNFGQRSFSYTPPAGFLALNTQNLPEPSIKKPSSYMDVDIYTGNGTTRSRTGFAFQPDFIWNKIRSQAYDHNLVDSVRGSTLRLQSNNTGAESTLSNGITSFNSDGYSLGSYVSTNGNGESIVNWLWKKSATPGFDIVTYTGTGSATTVAHNLGVAPKMIIAKNRTSASSWDVYHIGLTSANYRVQLNSTGAESVSNGSWNGTAPTSTVFSVKDDTATNSSGASHVAYLWSEVAGFSKFGSYTGNGSSDGPFVFCGFRPRWIMIKNATLSGGNWRLFDTARQPYNVGWMDLYANDSTNETAHSTPTTNQVDVLSNGFKLRDSLNETNRNGDTLVFAAFAESPFKYSLAR